MKKTVFKRFYSQLVQALPMDDVKFTATLYSANLLPGDTKDLVNSKPTTAAKAAKFLDFIIKSLVANESFDVFMKVMEDSEFDHVRKLAKRIRYELEEEQQQWQKQQWQQQHQRVQKQRWRPLQWHQYSQQQQKQQKQKQHQQRQKQQQHSESGFLVCIQQCVITLYRCPFIYCEVQLNRY